MRDGAEAKTAMRSLVAWRPAGGGPSTNNVSGMHLPRSAKAQGPKNRKSDRQPANERRSGNSPHGTRCVAKRLGTTHEIIPTNNARINGSFAGGAALKGGTRVAVTGHMNTSVMGNIAK